MEAVTHALDEHPLNFSTMSHVHVVIERAYTVVIKQAYTENLLINLLMKLSCTI